MKRRTKKEKNQKTLSMNTFESFHETVHISSDMLDWIRSVFVHPIEERFPAKRHTDTNVSARGKPAVE